MSNPAIVTVLLFEPIVSDQAALEGIFSSSAWPLCPGSTWKLRVTPTVRAALAALRRSAIPLVVCGCDREPGAWRAMLAQFELLSDPPSLILTSKHADDRLWVEALNLGAYDVLAKPFDRAEVIRTISCAWLRRQGTHGQFAAASYTAPAPASENYAPPKAC